MDVKRTLPIQPGDRPGDRRAAPEARSETPRATAHEESRRTEQSRQQRQAELQESAAERTARSQRVAREVSRVVREEVMASVAGSDRIELSPAGQAAASSALEQASAGEEQEVLRARHVAALKAAIEAGNLHTPERLERAARRMLGDLG